MLRKIGKDRRSVVASLNQGLEVVGVEPADRGIGGKVVGLIDQGRLRIVLSHEPEPPGPRDWRLLKVDASPPKGHPLAVLRAIWHVDRGLRKDDLTSDATRLLDQIKEINKQYEDCVKNWQPPVIDAGTQVLHVSKKLRQDDAFSDEVLDDLFASNTEVFVVKLLTHRKTGKTGLQLFLPSHDILLNIYQASFENTDVGHWLLTSLERKTYSVDLLCRLSAVWLPASQADDTEVRSENWLVQISNAERAYHSWRITWSPRELHAGFIRLCVSERSKEELQQHKLTPEQLCQAMTRGLHLYEVTGQESDVLVAVPEGLQCQIRLTPQKPLIGISDWMLIGTRKADLALSPFARIVARWEEGVPGRTPLAGNAPELIRELLVLQGQQQEIATRIKTVEEWLIGKTPELSKRIASWRKVCELERDTLEVGVTCLKREGPDYLLIPEKQETVKEWIDGLVSLNPEGIHWDRYPLELRVGEDYARLIIRSVQGTEDGVGEIVLNVGCDSPRGLALIERVCDSAAAEDKERENIRLFLPDTQLRLIDNALDLLDLDQQNQAEKRGIVGEELTLDDMTLNTLRTILSSPEQLDPITSPWPPLPIPPLTPLSAKQEEAVRAAIFGPDMTLIQGPPGTGKTTVILEILRQLFRMHRKNPGFKVLLVAPTHVAVDNVLERLVTPRGGTNLVMELGIAPYRVGSTHRIPEHLRGFTLDCFNTEYREKLEQQVGKKLEKFRQALRRDRQVWDILEDGAACDAVSWSFALQNGELLNLGPWECHPALERELPIDFNCQEGRVRAWRQLRAQGTRPEECVRLLRRWLEFLQKNPRFFSELLIANANLVCATTIGCATHRELRSVVYDYVIVDEAGKEEARRLLVPLIRGEKWVLVGDHQQLPPYSDDELQKRLRREGLDPKVITRSLFEELQEPFEKSGRYVFLDHQGRMHPDISAFVSQQFYGGRLHDFPHVANHTMPRPAFLPDRPNLLVLDTQQLPDRQEKRLGTGYVNSLEQELAVFILRAFAKLPEFQVDKADDKESSVPTLGVIAPYRRQVEKIRDLLRKDQKLNKLLSAGILHVGTVDSFQGQERDLIIFTCTRSNSQGRLGFVDNRQRLNVAFSRARCLLLVIADGSTVELARKRSDVTGDEAETRDHLHALFVFAHGRGGLLKVPQKWQTRWSG
ncbi:AAA family ATPase [thermophilic bacterium 2918]|uniref:AAA family ATPase n=2 Tax=Thermogemmata fonticola TaxID=2755323 RepID=A0A7V8VAZ4_9BACT|nr:AAA family ATPase [Thermogemmata fonticola]